MTQPSSRRMRRQRSFIQIHSRYCPSHPHGIRQNDPAVAIDGVELRRVLRSLESFSGE